ncbi:MAG: hypothetical protein Q9213_002162 [Squamulea squamosa]
MDQLPPGFDASKIPLLPPPAGTTSNFVDPPTLASVAEGVGGLLIAIETVLLALRTWTNFKTFRKLRLEDCMPWTTLSKMVPSQPDLDWTIFAAILTYGYFALIMRFRPIARHIWDVPLIEATENLYKARRSFRPLPIAVLTEPFQTIFAQEMMVGSTIFFSKTSLLLLFYRLFSIDKWFRYKLYAAFTFIAITTLPSIPMYLAVCLPNSDGSWAGASQKCTKTNVYAYVQGPVGVIFDVFAIYLPASVIATLHLPLRRKIGVLAIFMTGMFAVIASIVGLVYRIRLIHSPDATWAAYIVELCLYDPPISELCSLTQQNYPQ